MLPSQVGKTLLILCLIAYFISEDPSEILYVRETDEAVKDFSRERLSKLFADLPALRNLIGPSQRDSKNRIQHKDLNGAELSMASAGSIAGISGRAKRVLLIDEFGRFRAHISGGENPLKQIRQRAENFPNKIVVLVSTPGNEGTCEVEAEYKKGTQELHMIPCPHCGEYFAPTVDTLRTYRHDDNTPHPERAHIECPECRAAINDRQRMAAIDNGRWTPQRPERSRKIRSFHCEGLSSKFRTHARVAELYQDATSGSDGEKLKDFYNLTRGKPAPQPGTVIHVEGFEKRRELYPDSALPSPILLLTATVDVQDHRLEYEVRGRSQGGDRWGVQYGMIPGNTEQPQPWQALDEILQRTHTTEDGRELVIACVLVDAGGHRGKTVMDWTQPRNARHVYAIRGRGGDTLPVIAPKPSLWGPQSTPWYAVGFAASAAALFAALQIPAGEPGHCHYPINPERGYDHEYFRGLLSERRRIVTSSGRHRVIWEKIKGRRNEPFDLARYNEAAFQLFGADLDVIAERVANRPKQQPLRAAPPAAPPARHRPARIQSPPPTPPGPPHPAPPQPRPRPPIARPPTRRVFSTGIG